jgi:hypothetical protein
MSHLSLRPGITCCEAGGRLIFLDQKEDRYFGLEGAAEAVVEMLIAGSTLTPAQSVIATRLESAGILVSGEGKAGLCSPPHRASRSLLDEALPRVSALQILRTAYALQRARWLLSIAGLERSLLATAYRKRPRTSLITGPTIYQIAAGFVRTAALATAYDRCLPRSLAVSHMLAAQRIPHTLVIGVHVRPFHAHCWVQQHDIVINDHVEVVREFTPILVL